jgi:hypothetical protein
MRVSKLNRFAIPPLDRAASTHRHSRACPTSAVEGLSSFDYCADGCAAYFGS